MVLSSGLKGILRFFRINREDISREAQHRQASKRWTDSFHPLQGWPLWPRVVYLDDEGRDWVCYVPAQLARGLQSLTVVGSVGIILVVVALMFGKHGLLNRWLLWGLLLMMIILFLARYTVDRVRLGQKKIVVLEARPSGLKLFLFQWPKQVDILTMPDVRSGVLSWDTISSVVIARRWRWIFPEGGRLTIGAAAGVTLDASRPIPWEPLPFQWMDRVFLGTAAEESGHPVVFNCLYTPRGQSFIVLPIPFHKGHRRPLKPEVYADYFRRFLTSAVPVQVLPEVVMDYRTAVSGPSAD